MKLLLLLERVVKGLRKQVGLFPLLFFKKHSQSISELRVFPIIITSFYISTV